MKTWRRQESRASHLFTKTSAPSFTRPLDESITQMCRPIQKSLLIPSVPLNYLASLPSSHQGQKNGMLWTPSQVPQNSPHYLHTQQKLTEHLL